MTARPDIRIDELVAALSAERPGDPQVAALTREMSSFATELRSLGTLLVEEVASSGGDERFAKLASLVATLENRFGAVPEAAAAVRGAERLLYSWEELASPGAAERDPSIPSWGPAAFASTTEIIGGAGFPCIFGRRAGLARTGWTCFVESIADDAGKDRVRRALLQYLAHIDQLPVHVAVQQPFQVLVKPSGRILSVVEYGDQAWDLFQYLHDHDEQPWPADTPTDPDTGTWSFCFAGRELFSNVSNPAYKITKSRHVGPCLAFAMQPRKNFDVVADSATPQGHYLRERIRAKVEAYEGRPFESDELGAFGSDANREWKQMVRQEGDEPYPERWCPLHIRRQPKPC
ncbi:MAG: YqcI/YcgG family protein [Deltaproteobacteria bacterium]|nr:YqcI/YcgG family protein [Deltaproteobacteria bacterium]